MTKLPIRFAAALLFIALAGPSFAQFGGGMGGGGMGGRRGSGGSNSSTPHGDNFSSPTTLSSIASDRLYDLRLRLMITKEQSPLWDAFQTKAWDLLVHNAIRAPAGSDFAVVQAVRMRADQMQVSAQQWSALADSVDRLYQALSPEQRQVADQELMKVLPTAPDGTAPKPDPSSGDTGPRKSRPTY